MPRPWKAGAPVKFVRVKTAAASAAAAASDAKMYRSGTVSGTGQQ